MNLEGFASEFNEEDVALVELVVYRRGKDGTLIRETYAIDYFEDEDFQWSRTTKPIA